MERIPFSIWWNTNIKIHTQMILNLIQMIKRTSLFICINSVLYILSNMFVCCLVYSQLHSCIHLYYYVTFHLDNFPWQYTILCSAVFMFYVVLNMQSYLQSSELLNNKKKMLKNSHHFIYFSKSFKTFLKSCFVLK